MRKFEDEWQERTRKTFCTNDNKPHHTTPSIESHASLDENGNVHRESHLICSFKTKKCGRRVKLSATPMNKQAMSAQSVTTSALLVSFCSVLLLPVPPNKQKKSEIFNTIQHNQNGPQFISISHKYRFRLSIDFSFFETIFFRSVLSDMYGQYESVYNV